MKKALLLVAPVIVLLPFAAFALDVTPVPTPINSFAGLLNLITTITNILFTVLIVLAVIFFLLAAFNYLTSSGDPAKVKTAHSMIVYGALAIGVALLARAIPLIVNSIVCSGTSCIS